jgi:hypothetical protein
MLEGRKDSAVARGRAVVERCPVWTFAANNWHKAAGLLVWGDTAVHM